MDERNIRGGWEKAKGPSRKPSPPPPPQRPPKGGGQAGKPKG
jgi:hypothetical protein